MGTAWWILPAWHTYVPEVEIGVRTNVLTLRLPRQSSRLIISGRLVSYSRILVMGWCEVGGLRSLRSGPRRHLRQSGGLFDHGSRSIADLLWRRLRTTKTKGFLRAKRRWWWSSIFCWLLLSVHLNLLHVHGRIKSWRLFKVSYLRWKKSMTWCTISRKIKVLF